MVISHHENKVKVEFLASKEESHSSNASSVFYK